MRCTGCGSYLDVTTGTDHAYRVHESVCFSCRSIAEYQRSKDKHWNRDGLRLSAEPVPLASLQPAAAPPGG
ncbi:MAG: hypothetical protein AAGC63_00330 [Propionicimonas sp.]|nr:hypothetical protein [Propionicimonas sp.]